MKALVGAFNQKKALIRAFSVIEKTDGSFAALVLCPLSPPLLVAVGVGRDFVFVIYSNRGFFLSKQHSMEYSNCYVGGFMHKQYVYVSASGIFIKNILLFSAKILLSSLRKLTPGSAGHGDVVAG